MHGYSNSPLYASSCRSKLSASPQPEYSMSRHDDRTTHDLRKRTTCETRPMNVCTEEKVLETKSLHPVPVSQQKNGKSLRMLSVGIASFIILAVILWAVMYFLRPSIIVDSETGEVEQSKAILASIIFSLIIVVFVGILVAFSKKNGKY